ncbi:hypothetical protein evm_006691 [Chilo suppressalis]|nr:hypothetical protein evm_006691 [Chilo suppressalis]
MDIRTYLFIFAGLCEVSSSRVLELSDKFIDISNDGMWFVKFYAPWCAHCRRLEPIWAHVAQNLYNSPIKVAKVDCTRFTAVATHFKIRAYPTIMFLKGSFQHEYTGDRVKEDMVNYALRMSQPAIQKVSQADSLGYLKETHPVFFGYIGKQQGPLWESFTFNAQKYQPHTWFYTMSHDIIKQEITPPNETAVFVYKEDDIFFFDGPRLPTLNVERYIRECSEPHVIPYADYVGPNFLFMHDNARAHAAGIVREYFRDVNITVMDWPARSPDMNPIEHMWDELKRRVRARQPVAQTMQEFKTAIEEEWEMIPQNFIERLINSMPNRMRAVVDAHGGNTRY